MTVQDRLHDYLQHICQAIERIDTYIQNMDEAAFLSTPLVQDATIRNLEIIGEASHNITRRYPEFTASHPELPLTFAWKMRNVLTHGYAEVDAEVDAEIVWRIFKHDLPILYQQIQTILQSP